MSTTVKNHFRPSFDQLEDRSLMSVTAPSLNSVASEFRPVLPIPSQVHEQAPAIQVDYGQSSLAAVAPAFAKSTIGIGPKLASSEFYEIGGRNVTFIAKVTSGTFSYNNIASNAKSIAKNYTGNSHVWDDLYYYRTLKTSGNQYLIVLFKETGSNKVLGWAAVKNSPTTWNVIRSTKKGIISHPGNDQQIKTTYSVFGTRVDIDIKNPKNTGGFTANDILYSFGF